MSDRVAIVTGASSGIGRAVAVLAARSGWSLVLSGRCPSRLAETAEMLALHDDASAVCVTADLQEADAARHLADSARQAMGRIDAVISVAGEAKMVPLHEETREHMQRLLLINAIAPAELVAACWADLDAAQPGRVIVFSSRAAADPLSGLCAYGMGKSAAEGLVRSIHSDSAGRIIALGVGPGAVETPMLRGLIDESVLPPEACMAPEDPADLVMHILAGEHDEAAGTTLYILEKP